MNFADKLSNCCLKIVNSETYIIEMYLKTLDSVCSLTMVDARLDGPEGRVKAWPTSG